MPKRLINHNATLVALKRAIIIRADDGSSLVISPALARALAENLPRFADLAEQIIEDIPNRPEQLGAILVNRRDVPIQ